MPPIISVIIPCRNEEKFIGRCLDSILNQDFPKENLEILVIDGRSEDKTREIIKKYTGQYSFIKLLENPQRFTPFGLNIGLREARGEIIIRMDSHATYQKDYLSKCLKYLKETGADNVGGVIKTLPQKNTLIAKAIALSLSHFFGAGSSYFRIGSKKLREVDTVFGGCYKKEVFEKIGPFNEKLIRSQDIEFNKRLKKAGGKILLVPEIVAFYYPQPNLSGFFKHNFSDGFWTIYPLKFGIKIFSFRHLVPLFFISGLLGSLILGIFFFWGKVIFILIFGIYFLLNLFFSAQISLSEGLKYLAVLPVAFAVRHFSYGLGSLFGLIKILI